MAEERLRALTAGSLLIVTRLLGMVASLLLVACAAAKPGSFIGYMSLGEWAEKKAERLNECKHDRRVKTEQKALRCLGGFKKHRGTGACVDASAWVARVAEGIKE